MHNLRFVIILFLSISCSTTEIIYIGARENPVAISTQSAKIQIYKKDILLEYFLFGTIPSEQTIDLSDELELGLKEKKSLISVEEVQTSSDLWATYLSFGLYTPITVRLIYSKVTR